MAEENLLIHPEALHCLQRKQLVSLCRRMDVKATGKNSELISRLQAFANTTIKTDSPTKGALVVLRNAEEASASMTPLNIRKRSVKDDVGPSTGIPSPIKTRATRSRIALASSDSINAESPPLAVEKPRRASGQRKASAAKKEKAKAEEENEEENTLATKKRTRRAVAESDNNGETVSRGASMSTAQFKSKIAKRSRDSDDAPSASSEPNEEIVASPRNAAGSRLPVRSSRRKGGPTVSASDAFEEATFAERHDDADDVVASNHAPMSEDLSTAKASAMDVEEAEPSSVAKGTEFETVAAAAPVAPSLTLPSADVSMDLDFELLNVPSNAPSGPADYGAASCSEFGSAVNKSAEKAEKSSRSSLTKSTKQSPVASSPAKDSPFKSVTGSLRSIASAFGLSPSKTAADATSAGTKRKAEDDAHEQAEDATEMNMPGGMPSPAAVSAPVFFGQTLSPPMSPVGPCNPTSSLAGRVIKPRPSRTTRQSIARAPASIVSPVPTSPQASVFTATDQQFSDATAAVLANLNARLVASGRAPTTLTLDKVSAAVASADGSPVPGSIRIVPRKPVADERFKETHTREFEKMDSIATHWAAQRPVSGLGRVEEAPSASSSASTSASAQVASPANKRVKLSSGEPASTASRAVEEEAEREATRRKLQMLAQRRRSGVAPRASVAAKAASKAAAARKPSSVLGGALAGVKGRVFSAAKGLFGSSSSKAKTTDAGSSAVPDTKKKNVFDLKASLSRKPKGYTPYSLKDALAGHASTSISKASTSSRLAPSASLSSASSSVRSPKAVTSSSTTFPTLPTPLSPPPKLALPAPASPLTLLSPATRRPRIDPSRFVANNRQALLGVSSTDVGPLAGRRSLAGPLSLGTAATSRLLSPPRAAGPSKVRTSMPGPRARAGTAAGGAGAGAKNKSSASRAVGAGAGALGRGDSAAVARAAAARTRVNAGLSPMRGTGGVAGRGSPSK